MKTKKNTNRTSKKIKISKKSNTSKKNIIELFHNQKKYTLNILEKTSFYKDFNEIINYKTLQNYLNQFNYNDTHLEQKIVENYFTFSKNLFYEYRVIKIPSPFPIFNISDFITDYYKKNKGFDICVISNIYSHIVPFLLFDYNITLLNDLQKNTKIMLYKNLLTTKDPVEYSKIMDIINLKKKTTDMVIEGDFEYDINNYLIDYIENKTLLHKLQVVLIFISYYMVRYFKPKLFNYCFDLLYYN